jgi:hypothetical protein
MDGMRTGVRTLGPASLKLSYNQQVAPHLRGGLRELSHLECTEPKKGHATKLMQEVCSEADKENIMLLLHVEPYGEMDKAALQDWYSRLGFFILQETPTIMVRQAHGVRKLFNG